MKKYIAYVCSTNAGESGRRIGGPRLVLGLPPINTPYQVWPDIPFGINPNEHIFLIMVEKAVIRQESPPYLHYNPTINPKCPIPTLGCPLHYEALCTLGADAYFPQWYSWGNDDAGVVGLPWRWCWWLDAVTTWMKMICWWRKKKYCRRVARVDIMLTLATSPQEVLSLSNAKLAALTDCALRCRLLLLSCHVVVVASLLFSCCCCCAAVVTQKRCIVALSSDWW